MQSTSDESPEGMTRGDGQTTVDTAIKKSVQLMAISGDELSFDESPEGMARGDEQTTAGAGIEETMQSLAISGDELTSVESPEGMARGGGKTTAGTDIDYESIAVQMYLRAKEEAKHLLESNDSNKIREKDLIRLKTNYKRINSLEKEIIRIKYSKTALKNKFKKSTDSPNLIKNMTISGTDMEIKSIEETDCIEESFKKPVPNKPNKQIDSIQTYIDVSKVEAYIGLSPFDLIVKIGIKATIVCKLKIIYWELYRKEWNEDMNSEFRLKSMSEQMLIKDKFNELELKEVEIRKEINLFKGQLVKEIDYYNNRVWIELQNKIQLCESKSNDNIIQLKRINIIENILVSIRESITECENRLSDKQMELKSVLVDINQFEIKAKNFENKLKILKQKIIEMNEKIEKQQELYDNCSLTSNTSDPQVSRDRKHKLRPKERKAFESTNNLRKKQLKETKEKLDSLETRKQEIMSEISDLTAIKRKSELQLKSRTEEMNELKQKVNEIEDKLKDFKQKELNFEKQLNKKRDIMTKESEEYRKLLRDKSEIENKNLVFYQNIPTQKWNDSAEKEFKENLSQTHLGYSAAFNPNNEFLIVCLANDFVIHFGLTKNGFEFYVSQK